MTTINHTRRDFLRITSLGTAGFGLLGCGKQSFTSNDSLVPLVAADHPIEKQLSKTTFPVHSMGPASSTKYAALFRHFHGGSTFIKHFTKDPEMFGHWYLHQNRIFNACKKLIDTYGAENVRFACEGESLPSLQEDPSLADTYSMFEEISQDVTARVSDPENVSEYLKEQHQRYFIDLENMKFELLTPYLPGFQLYAYCLNRGFNNTVMSTDPPGHWNLRVLTFARIRELCQMGDLSDQFLENELQKLRDLSDQDNKVRHDYVRSLMEKEPNVKVWGVVLGGSHFESGYQNPKILPPDYSLEDALSPIEDRRMTVWEDISFQSLGLYVGKKDAFSVFTATPEIFRAVIEDFKTLQD